MVANAFYTRTYGFTGPFPFEQTVKTNAGLSVTKDELPADPRLTGRCSVTPQSWAARRPVSGPQPLSICSGPVPGRTATLSPLSVPPKTPDPLHPLPPASREEWRIVVSEPDLGLNFNFPETSRSPGLTPPPGTQGRGTPKAA